MKIIPTLIAAFSCWASAIVSAATLKPGDPVAIDAVTQAKFLTGQAPKAWEPGKVYVLECWATWCGPCVAAIPHVNELHGKLHARGLRVIGMNVWEEDEAKVKDFLAKKGDGMAYPVAHVGKESAFTTDWLEAAGVQGIPHAFVVKDGKLLFSTHPMELDAATVESLLAGGEKERAAVEAMTAKGEAAAKGMEENNAQAQAERAARKERIGDFEEQFEALVMNKDADGAIQLADQTLAKHPKMTGEDRTVVMMGKFVATLMKGDEAAATALVEEMEKAIPTGAIPIDFAEIKANIPLAIEKVKAQLGGDETPPGEDAKIPESK